MEKLRWTVFLLLMIPAVVPGCRPAHEEIEAEDRGGEIPEYKPGTTEPTEAGEVVPEITPTP